MMTRAVPEPVVVGAGAALGAVARYGVMLAVPAASVVLLVDAVACLAMGYFAPGKFWGMGVLGGFSTWSAVAVAAARSSAIGALATLVMYFVVCVGAWLLGDAWRARSRRRP